ncbi:carbon-nitrogen hydrolase [Corynascus novoguineensis]|uniref:Carbon-nitrogen hydrolase n=1 Tax=Corynascus novoguineensis TaxID=1126955 RepID=A0AAN7CJR5_9PEZI|nr:carbon-nitrogen hydrolase [Corynascus novoguineensis]
MKLACLQFAPQLGDIDSNLSRADAVLRKADPNDLDLLDLLVLPELAFTGYNFRSLQHIYPSIEDAGSISFLWAQTTALKHDCTVVVGYPEKADAKCSGSPEYYDSALIVNGDGDIAGNYRKSFLYCADETWARESSDGFFRDKRPGLGNIALGIGTDLNPYKLDTPWDAFEFGNHILEADANVVILPMAWQTHQDPRSYGHNPQEPDVETLVYWVQRLEPVIRKNKDGEVIVVFCNRTGAEEGAVYTGTSAVAGIRRGEVVVYGVLGRGVADLLVVDTDCPPRYKLTDTNTVEADKVLDGTSEGEYEVCQLTLADSIVFDSPFRERSRRSPWSETSDRTPAEGRSAPRLQLEIPSSQWSFPGNQSPYPWHFHDGSHSAAFGRGAIMTPITPFEEDGRNSTPIDPEPPHWVWRHEPSLPTLNESIGEEEPSE